LEESLGKAYRVRDFGTDGVCRRAIFNLTDLDTTCLIGQVFFIGEYPRPAMGTAPEGGCK
jgi:hypothetical protein